MKVNPINSALNSVKNAVAQRKELKNLTEEFLDSYGNEIDSYQTFKNKKGVLAVLGFDDNFENYTHALAKKADGTRITTLVNRGSVNKFGKEVDTFLKTTTKGSNVEVKGFDISLSKDTMKPLVMKFKKAFRILPRETKVIDIRPYFKK